MKIGVLTISDRSSTGEREDKTGPALSETVESLGWQVAMAAVVSDDQSEIEGILREWCDTRGCDAILTAGGTGFSPRDRAPEATIAIADRMAPGMAEAMRAASLEITPHAMLSRSVAAIRASTLIVNLPGSPRAAIENLRVIQTVLPHAVDLLRASPEAEAGHRPRIDHQA